MKVSKIYKFATWALLLLNIALLGFFFLAPPDMNRGNGPSKGMGKDMLNLGDEQKDLFQASANKHQRLMESLSKDQADLLNAYFDNLITFTNHSQKDSLLSNFTNVEAQKLELTYEHFEEVKEILTDDQFENFEKFISE
jgi:hypothetical protein